MKNTQLFATSALKFLSRSRLEARERNEFNAVEEILNQLRAGKLELTPVEPEKLPVAAPVEDVKGDA